MNAVINARKFYVDPSSTASTSNGSISAPFKSIAQVNSTVMYAGDSVFLRVGKFFPVP